MLLPICVWCVIVGEVLRPSLDDVSMPVLCVLRALDCVLRSGFDVFFVCATLWPMSGLFWTALGHGADNVFMYLLVCVRPALVHRDNHAQL